MSFKPNLPCVGVTTALSLALVVGHVMPAATLGETNIWVDQVIVAEIPTSSATTAFEYAGKLWQMV